MDEIEARRSARRYRERPVPDAGAARRAGSRRLAPAIKDEVSPWRFRCIRRFASAPMSMSQHLRGRQALSAGADAGAAVPLQPRLRRLRQDRLSRPDPQPAPVGRRSASRRSMNAARRSSSIAGGEPLLHREIEQIVEGIIARKKFVYLCTNALLLEKKIDLFKPNPYFAWSIHLDGDQEITTARSARRRLRPRGRGDRSWRSRAGFRVNINATLFDNADPERMAAVLRRRSRRSASTASRCRPAMPMSARPTRSISSTGARTKELFRDIFRRDPNGAALVVQPVEPVPRFPGRQPDLSLHAVGQPDAATISAGSGPATCSAKATPRPSRS